MAASAHGVAYLVFDVEAIGDGKIRFGIVMRGSELTPSDETDEEPDSGEPGAFSVMADSRLRKGSSSALIFSA